MNDGNDETLLLLFVEMREPVIMRSNKIVLYRTRSPSCLQPESRLRGMRACLVQSSVLTTALIASSVSMSGNSWSNKVQRDRRNVCGVWMSGWSSAHMALEHSNKTSLDSRLNLRRFWPSSTQSTCRLYFDFRGRLVLALHAPDLASLLAASGARAGAFAPAASSAHSVSGAGIFSQWLAPWASGGLDLTAFALLLRIVEIFCGNSVLRVRDFLRRRPRKKRRQIKDSK